MVVECFDNAAGGEAAGGAGGAGEDPPGQFVPLTDWPKLTFVTIKIAAGDDLPICPTLTHLPQFIFVTFARFGKILLAEKSHWPRTQTYIR